MDKACVERILPCVKEMPCVNPEQKTGVVFNIQQFTVHDGPGIRTEIFLKGCHLRCKWCSNPESFEVKSQVGVYPNSCIGISKCGKCLEACPKVKQGALVIEGDRIASINRDICNDCKKCQTVCPSAALKLWGKEMTVAQVMQRILDDKSFYDKSGGGVTVSGGESLYQWRFTREILKECREQGVHTCVETALCVKQDILEKILPYTDMIITDIKHMNTHVHKQYTDVGNELILSNIKWTVESGVPVVLRVPIIPDINDSEAHITQIADFITNELGNKVKQVQFLRFRRLGEEKYASLGIPYNMTDINPDREKFETHIKKLVEIMSSRGIPAFAGTTHKINLN